MTAAIPFPASARVLAVPVPVVTIGRYRSLPKEKPYKASVTLFEEVAGWAVEVLNHPEGGIAILGFFRDEATAWQAAATLARQNGWHAERNRRLALATARRLGAGGRS